MKALPRGSGEKMARMEETEIREVLVRHDSHISSLNGRIGSVEKTLSEHGGALQRIENAVTKQDARPVFNFHQSVSTVLSLAVLFSMVVGGIIWVTQTQFASVIAEQKGVNAAIVKSLDKHEDRLDRHESRITLNEAAIGRWTTQTARAR